MPIGFCRKGDEIRKEGKLGNIQWYIYTKLLKKPKSQYFSPCVAGYVLSLCNDTLLRFKHTSQTNYIPDWLLSKLCMWLLLFSLFVTTHTGTDENFKYNLFYQCYFPEYLRDVYKMFSLFIKHRVINPNHNRSERSTDTYVIKKLTENKKI